jgi:FkbM family methyltransferase
LEDVRARGFAPTHVVDVGANRGDWSRIAHTVWPHATFTLIEPQVEMKPHIDAFTEQVASRWIQAGAADAAGELTLTVNPDPVSSTFAPTESEADGEGLSNRRVVPVITLDSLLAEKDTVPELVKVDAQELELSVLRGAQRYFGSPELFVVEVSLFKWHSSTATIVDVVAFYARERLCTLRFLRLHETPAGWCPCTCRRRLRAGDRDASGSDLIR